MFFLKTLSFGKTNYFHSVFFKMNTMETRRVILAAHRGCLRTVKVVNPKSAGLVFSLEDNVMSHSPDITFVNHIQTSPFLPDASDEASHVADIRTILGLE